MCQLVVIIDDSKAGKPRALPPAHFSHHGFSVLLSCSAAPQYRLGVDGVYQKDAFSDKEFYSNMR